MNWNFLLTTSEKVVEYFRNSKEAKEFVVHLLERYEKSTDNEIDDMIVDIVRKKLLTSEYEDVSEEYIINEIEQLG